MVMEAYFDESGIHDRAKVCVVAGFYGDQSSWREFENGWNAILSDYPALSGEGFHAKRFYGRKNGRRVGPYSRWSDDEAGQFLERLLSCVVSNHIFPIGYAVIVADFLALPLFSRQWFTGAKFSKVGRAKTSGCPNKPYYVPFQFCVLKAAQRAAAIAEDKLHISVGLDRNFHDYAAALYEYLLVDERVPESLRDRLGTLRNPPAKDTPGIQAADLIAYVMYGSSLAALENPDYHPPEALMRLLKNWQGEPTLKPMNTEIFNAIEQSAKAEYERRLRSGRS